MAIKVIKTSDGDKLRDTNTGKLAGSAPKKPRVPTVNATVVANKTADVNSKEEPSPVEKSFEQFSKVKSVEAKYEDNFDFILHEAKTGEHTIYAVPKGSGLDEGNEVGWISWVGRDSGRIAHIEVKHEHRRKGLATALYNQASHISMEIGLKPPRHHEVRTKDGDIWARAVGGDLPLVACGVCGETGHYWDPDDSCMDDDENF